MNTMYARNEIEDRGMKLRIFTATKIRGTAFRSDQ